MRPLSDAVGTAKLIEHSFAHLYEHPGACAPYLHARSHVILKRLLIHVGGFNLGLLMRARSSVRDAALPPGRGGRAVAAVVSRPFQKSA